MAIGNANEDRTSLAQPAHIFDILPQLCTDHNDTKATLFCQTCDILICINCVSSADVKNVPRHSKHVYTDLVQAYDIKKVILCFNQL